MQTVRIKRAPRVRRRFLPSKTPAAPASEKTVPIRMVSRPNLVPFLRI